MFAVEITFKDSTSESETLLVRRPQVIIGGSDYAHVVIEDMKALNFQIKLSRDLGRRFSCKPVPTGQGGSEGLSFEGGSYEGEASIDLGVVRFLIYSLDVDFALKEGEAADKAGVKVLRRACSTFSPSFPAIAVGDENPVIVSFASDQPIYIGRSNQCEVRLEAADVSSRHARMGYERGEFWVEDLGSTNGTFIKGQQVSGRVNCPAGVPVILGREISVFGVTSEDQIKRAAQISASKIDRAPVVGRKYPALISVSEVVRPARLVLTPGSAFTLGRDPTSDMWLGAPHISRKHCAVALTAQGVMSISDHSTNGTAYGEGILKKGDSLKVDGKPRVLEFGGGVTVAICFNENDEQKYILSHGASNVFLESGQANGGHQPERVQGSLRQQPELAEKFGLGTGESRSLRQWIKEVYQHGVAGKLLVVAAFLASVSVMVVFLSLVSGVVKNIWF